MRYELPDMMKAHVDELVRQFSVQVETILARNVSDVTLVIPRRILARAGVKDRVFWEASCPNKVNPES